MVWEGVCSGCFSPGKLRPQEEERWNQYAVQAEAATEKTA